MRNDPFFHNKESRAIATKAFVRIISIILAMEYIPIYFGIHTDPRAPLWSIDGLLWVVSFATLILCLFTIITVGMHAIVPRHRPSADIKWSNLLGGTGYFSHADQEKLMRTRRLPIFYQLSYGYLFLILAGLFAYHVCDGYVYIQSLDADYLILAVLFFYALLHNLILPERYIEFNRLKGTVRVPSLLFPWHQTFPFEDVHVFAYDDVGVRHFDMVTMQKI